MTKQEFLEYCANTHGIAADYSFDENFEVTRAKKKGKR